MRFSETINNHIIFCKEGRGNAKARLSRILFQICFRKKKESAIQDALKEVSTYFMQVKNLWLLKDSYYFRDAREAVHFWFAHLMYLTL